MQLILGPELERQKLNRKWLVLIAAYTGARLSELAKAELTRADISSNNNVANILINNNNGKRLKSGFLEWVETKDDNLFHKPVRNFGAWFNNTYLSLLEIENKSFH